MKAINAETIATSIAGNQDAASAIYRSVLPRAKTLAYKIMRSFPSDQEDAAQDAMVHLFRKLPLFRGESAFSTWSHRVITNFLLMELRKRRGDRNPANCLEAVDVHPGEDGSSFYVVADPRNAFAQVDARIDAQRVLSRLPKGYRGALEMREILGLSHEECSRAVGATVGNSKSQWHKAKQRAREIADNMSAFDEVESMYTLPGRPAEPVIAAPIVDGRKGVITTENIERLHRAATEEFKACSAWQPLLEASAREIEALKLRISAEKIDAMVQQ